MLIGVFFISSLQLVFLGVMGEYIGAIYTQVQNRPYVVELDRINFEDPPSLPKSDAPAAFRRQAPVSRAIPPGR